MSDNKEIEFAEISNYELLLNYLKKKALNHTYYKIYTKYNRAENILNSHAVYLSQGTTWNDITDRNVLNNENYDKTNFAICFSCRQSEDVSMWMLYAGKNDGCMVDLKKDIIQDLSEAKKISLGYFSDESFIETKTLDQNSFDIVLQDIVYFKKTEKSSFDLKHPGDNANKYFYNIDFLKYFKKKRPWLYENECRLVVSIDKSFVPNEKYQIKIEFDENLIKNGKIKVYKSPVSNNLNVNYEKSNLTNEIDWDLCNDCDEKNKCKTCKMNREIA